MKKIGVLFGSFILAALVVGSVAGSGNYSPSNSAVERNLAGAFIADGSPRPPVPPMLVVDGCPRPPVPPATFDGSPRPPVPPELSA
jgi:hypothetical protein